MIITKQAIERKLSIISGFLKILLFSNFNIFAYKEWKGQVNKRSGDMDGGGSINPLYSPGEIFLGWYTFFFALSADPFIKQLF